MQTCAYVYFIRRDIVYIHKSEYRYRYINWSRFYFYIYQLKNFSNPFISRHRFEIFLNSEDFINLYNQIHFL